jgi:hypothetical protein
MAAEKLHRPASKSRLPSPEGRRDVGGFEQRDEMRIGFGTLCVQNCGRRAPRVSLTILRPALHAALRHGFQFTLSSFLVSLQHTAAQQIVECCAWDRWPPLFSFAIAPTAMA